MRTISVLISCYNKAPYIQEAILSCHKSDNVIIVDDGSKDTSQEEIIAVLKARKTKLICQPNRGAANARNRALYEANEDYVIFMDGDDKLGENYIAEHLYAHQTLGDALVTYSPTRLLFTDKTIKDEKDEILAFFYKEYTSVADFVYSLMYDGWSPVIHGWCWPRKAVLESGGWRTDIIANDDFEFSIRVLSYCNNVLAVPTAYAYYRQLQISLSHARPSASVCESMFKSAQGRMLSALKIEDSKRMRKAITQWHYRVMLWVPIILYPAWQKKFKETIKSLGNDRIRFLQGKNALFARFFGFRLWYLQYRHKVLRYLRRYNINA